MDRLFNYKGYEITVFDYDYSREKKDKWQAANQEDCDEPMIIGSFDDILEEIDFRLKNE